MSFHHGALDFHLDDFAFVGLEKELNHIKPCDVFDPTVSDIVGFVMLEKLDTFEDANAIVGDDVTTVSGATGSGACVLPACIPFGPPYE